MTLQFAMAASERFHCGRDDHFGLPSLVPQDSDMDVASPARSPGDFLDTLWAKML